MIAALFVAKGGCYDGLPGVDAWTIERDARKYAGPWPVVAHPPCARWCQLAPLNERRYGHAIGDDGGCFESALRSVRTWGGVLEHPAWTLAWPRFDLPLPNKGAWQRGLIDRGWTTEIDQCAYGHRARKSTWLYYFGDAEPPALDWSRPDPSAKISWLSNHGGRALPSLGKREASATPLPLRDVLLAIARGS